MGKVTVICVNGVSRSGKDTFIDYLSKKVQMLVSHSTIDTVRSSLISGGMYDYREKGEKERAFLVAVKQAWIEYSDGPFEEVKRIVKNLEPPYKFASHIERVLLVVQVREKEEISKLVGHFGADIVTVKVVRPAVEPQPGDESVSDWNYDYTAYNDGDLEGLSTVADKFITFLSERN
jgi:hypothetical protein